MRLMLPLLLSTTLTSPPFFRTTTTLVRAFSPLTVSRTFRSSATLIPTTARVSAAAAAPFLRTMASKALRASTSSSSSADKKEAPFTTWTFDNPCETMDWTVSPGVTLTTVGTDDFGEVSDLVIVGVYAPASDEGEEDKDDEEEEEEDQEVAVVLDGKAAALDEMLGGALTDVAKENAKTFKNGAVAGTTTPTVRVVVKGEDGVTKSQRYILIGMGKAGKKLDAGTMTKIGSTIATKCDEEKGASSCAFHLPGNTEGPSSLTEFSQGFYNALYSDNRYRTGKNKKTKAEDLTTLTVVTDADVSGSVEEGARWAAGVSLGRDIVNAPHNILNSVSLAATARRIAEESGGVMTCEVLGKEECEARGMGAYLGVARGSETPPQFIHLTYKPSGDIKKKVGVIGKGLLFDTGGYNIKTAMMELMKFDCGGAGAVLGAARAVAALQPEGVEAHFIVAACENMINDRAVVPSDILTASNGKTIEVLNTDAEGRLTLADALVFADKELGCERIIELSTLTGACMISLGTKIAGVWTANDELAKELEDVSQLTGDKSWRMPLVKEYDEQLKSMIADIKNIGTRYGGAITAALFLQHFVGKKTPFAHIDIAGPVWSDTEGATGFGVKLVAEWVSRQGKEVEKEVAKEE